MDLHRIINIVAVALVFLDSVYFAVRLIKSKKAGKGSARNAEKGFLPRVVLIYLCAVAIIVLCFFMDFGLAGNIALNGCGVLAVEIANRQFLPIDKKD